MKTKVVRILHTGIIRRVDDLGRIVIPKEIRHKAGIKEGEPMEINVQGSSIILTKYNPEEYD